MQQNMGANMIKLPQAADPCHGWSRMDALEWLCSVHVLPWCPSMFALCQTAVILPSGRTRMQMKDKSQRCILGRPSSQAGGGVFSPTVIKPLGTRLSLELRNWVIVGGCTVGLIFLLFGLVCVMCFWGLFVCFKAGFSTLPCWLPEVFRTYFYPCL